jgi:GxxExxY protein
MRFDAVSNRIIGCAIEVHRHLGPGLLESTYERCMAHELASVGMQYEVQKPLPVRYKGLQLDCGYRVDMFIGDSVIVELKSVEKVTDTHRAQLLTYLKLAEIRVGLLINFNVRLLKDGLDRFVI